MTGVDQVGDRLEKLESAMRKQFEQWCEAWVLRSGRRAPGVWGWLVMAPFVVALAIRAYQSGRVVDTILATLFGITLLLDFERRAFYRIIERQQAALTALQWEKDALAAQLGAVAAQRTAPSEPSGSVAHRKLTLGREQSRADFSLPKAEGST